MPPTVCCCKVEIIIVDSLRKKYWRKLNLKFFFFFYKFQMTDIKTLTTSAQKSIYSLHQTVKFYHIYFIDMVEIKKRHKSETFPIYFYINTLRTGLLNCLNARSRGLIFRHRASCIQGQAFRYFPENTFYIFNQQIYFII